MKGYIEPIGRLINKFRLLPGVGEKTAQRFAYQVMNLTEEEVKDFANAIIEVKTKVRYCKEFGNYTENEICDICKERDKSIICVVKEPKDIISIERLNEFKGVYHVLHGVISPKDGVGIEDLSIKPLIEKIEKNGVKEVIFATGTSIEGDTTALALSYYIKPFNVKVTRLAQGIPIGTDIEYADEGSLSKAFIERKSI